MQAIFLIGLIFIFSLNDTHGSSKCYKSRICIHTNKIKCGRNKDGEIRRFLDSCDMKEFNCLQKTNYIPTDDKECEDLPEIDELEKPYKNDRSTNNNEKESNESNAPEEYITEPEERDKSAYIDVKESAELSTEKSNDYINESEKRDDDLNIDDETKELNEDVLEEFEPKANKEVKKMSLKVKKPSFESTYVTRGDVSKYSYEGKEDKENISGQDVILSSGDNVGINNEDYFFNKSFFGSRARSK